MRKIDTTKKNIGITSLDEFERKKLYNNFIEAGKHSVDFSTESLGNKIGAGVYFYTLTAGNFTQTKKMIILK